MITALLALLFPISSYAFQCSPIQSVGCSGLFEPRDARTSEVAVLDSGDLSLALRLQALESAKRSIRLQALIFTGDEAGHAVAEILKKKKKAGLDVRVIVDAVSNPSFDTQLMYYDLKQHKIEVEGYEAFWLQWINEVSLKDPTIVNKRFHDKMFVIDAEDEKSDTRLAVVGGLNTANEYFRVATESKMRWRDQDVAVRGAIIEDIAATFDRNFEYFKSIKNSRPDFLNTDKAWGVWRWVIEHTWKLKIPFKGKEALTAMVNDAAKRVVTLDWMSAKLRFFQNRPRFDESFIKQLYLEKINSAKSEIQIANAYFIPEKDIIDALKRAAGPHHVSVTVITNSRESNDMPQMADASRYLYKTLMESGVKIREWIGKEKKEGTLHAKYAVFDRKEAIVGSYNLDARSELLNSETVLEIDDERAAERLAKLYDDKDDKLSREVNWFDAIRYNDPNNAPEKFNLFLSLKLRPLL